MTPDDLPAASLDDGELTDAERSYLRSGGENADALLTENAGLARSPASPEPAKATEPASGAAQSSPATPSPEGAAKAGADDDDDDDPKRTPPPTVPYQKFSRETKKLKDQLAAREREAAELREKFSRGDERLRLLTEALTPQQQQEAEPDTPMPDPNTDLFGAFNWQTKQFQKLQQQLDEQRNWRTERETTERGQQEYAQLQQHFVSDARTFAAEHPDFGPAYQHLWQSRDAELQAAGYVDPQERARIIAQDERDVVARARAAGVSPSERMYALAKGRGFMKAAAPAAEAKPAAETAGTPPPLDGAPAATNNAAAPAPASAQPAPSAVAELERIRSGQNAGKSLSNAAGGQTNILSLETLATLPDDEYAALLTKYGSLEKMIRIAS